MAPTIGDLPSPDGTVGGYGPATKKSTYREDRPYDKSKTAANVSVPTFGGYLHEPDLLISSTTVEDTARI